MGRQLFTNLIEAVQASAVEDQDSGCWNWKGGLQSGARDSVPVMRWRGKVNSVRRFLAMEKYGGSHETHLKSRKFVATYSCGNPDCVNPEHVVISTRRLLQQRTAESSDWNLCPMLQKRRSDIARKNFAVLDQGRAEQIRLDERPQKQIAADYGVSQATVSSIKRGRTWKNYDSTNPFRGLMK
jgi:DNA-binding Xre family transcriptional regulator